MNNTMRRPQGGRDEPEAARAEPSESREDRLRRGARRIDEAEDDLMHDLADTKESTDAAGHRLAGPLDE